ncbi:hypothetical protein [Paracandidimonas soli]|uniref:Uncharacterized protein n=2 Tax=Paracandidimonas soli TaxID=1917182 RepID=A0A4R3UTX1_9BURK|nr:hypothetical protein [Paracandidimonas soli]TCU94552.1 hypothetical protein EV686_109107 [Paracandidimonas soli]
MRNPARLIGYCFAGIFLTANAAAQTADIDAQYAQERQYCATLQEPSRSACLKDAAAVRQEALRGARNKDDGSYRLNRTTRCDRLPAQQREDCLKLMSEQQPKVHGSVEGGGMIRETVIEIPAPATQVAPGVQQVQPAPAPAESLPVTPGR